MDRNEWGFEGWVPQDLNRMGDTELWSNYFASAVSFGSGIVVRVWDGEPYDSDCVD